MSRAALATLHSVSLDTAFSRSVHSLGVALKGRREGSRIPDRPRHEHVSLPALDGDVPYVFPRNHVLRSFISIANLANVRSLHTQTRDDWCVGLYIERHCVVPETLGQWDPADTKATAIQYEFEKSGPLKALTFIFPDDGSTAHRCYFYGVVVGDGADISDHTFTCDDLNKVSGHISCLEVPIVNH